MLADGIAGLGLFTAASLAWGWYDATAGIGASIGLVLGGVLADLVSWRVGFVIDLPIGALLMVDAQRHIAETPRRTAELDLAGALLSTLGMVAWVHGLVQVASDGWGNVVKLGAANLQQMDTAAAQLTVQGARLPEAVLRMTGG